MKIEIASGVSLDIDHPNDLIEMMDDKERMEAIESLSCNDGMIRFVTDRILEGWTEQNEKYGWTGGR